MPNEIFLYVIPYIRDNKLQNHDGRKTTMINFILEIDKF